MPDPIPMLLFCPACGMQHIDEGRWAREIVHRSHLCASCEHVWRQADVPTIGVAAITTEGAADGSPVPVALVHAERILRSERITKVMFDTISVALFDQVRVGQQPIAKGSTLARAVAKLRKERADG